MKWVSLFRWIVAAAMLSSLSPAFAQERPALSVQIHSQWQQSRSASNRITVTIRNVSDHAVYLPRHRTPLFTPENHLMGNLFEVTGDDGASAKFIGRYVRISPIDPSTYFERIDPGQSLSHDVDLAADYDLSSGRHYTVHYSQAFARDVKLDARGEIARTFDAQVPSNIAEFIADGGLALLMKNQATVADAGKVCTADQTSQIWAARAPAGGLILKATKAIEGLFTVEEGKDQFGNTTYKGQVKQDNAYAYWFGSPDNDNNKVYLSRPSYTDYWKDDDDFVMMRNISTLYLRIGAEGYLCGCSSEYPEATAAWTNTTSNTINLCDRFFSLPKSDGPYDSRLLTIIHEYSHFVDSWDSATADYAYGMSGAHDLATIDRTQAVRNADSVMYYIGTFNTSIEH